MTTVLALRGRPAFGLLRLRLRGRPRLTIRELRLGVAVEAAAGAAVSC